MRFLPVNLDIRDKAAVIAGGGKVAERRCRLLLDAGARVTVISPLLSPGLAELVGEGKVCHVPREYAIGDLTGAYLAIAATSATGVNRDIADEARTKGILANIVDAPDTGTFTIPSSFSRGDLLIAVSTAGKSPALGRAIRRQLELLFGQEYAVTLELLGKVREKLLTVKGNREYNKEIFNELVARDLPSLFRSRDFNEIDQLLLRLLGSGYTLAELGVGERDPL